MTQTSNPGALNASVLLEQPFGTLSALVRAYATEQPDHPALIQDDRTLDYAALDASMDRVAARLQQERLGRGDAIAICAATSLEYATLFLGALRAGVAVAPLAPSSTPASLAAMATNADARLLFLDADTAATLSPLRAALPMPMIALDDSNVGARYTNWLGTDRAKPEPVAVEPADPFNIIYSSGTTGTPKGIVQPHAMRWVHVQRAAPYEYGLQSVTLLATPLYSNTTLVCFVPSLAYGGTVVLMAKFDVAGYLELAQRHRVTHTMLVPVQYQRLMAAPEFGSYDLSAFRVKLCTSAPFGAALKADILARWPGGLVEFYGMTEGGGTAILVAHEFPDKLHTVGRPAAGHDIRLLDDAGNEVAPGGIGEVVGHSQGMMTGYYKRPDLTGETEWFDRSGRRFIRTGDVGRFDEDGFLTLLDRKKDMIISGGFNIYPSDLEAVLRNHVAVAEAAVVGVPSQRWGETPVAFVVMKPGASESPAALLAWANERVGKTQRLAAIEIASDLPRSAIGKVLKRELRQEFVARRGSVA
jgi:acyl-CoA synthetase (AMP-forming)/AMP-acid ligase II